MRLTLQMIRPMPPTVPAQVWHYNVQLVHTVGSTVLYCGTTVCACCCLSAVYHFLLVILELHSTQYIANASTTTSTIGLWSDRAEQNISSPSPTRLNETTIGRISLQVLLYGVYSIPNRNKTALLIGHVVNSICKVKYPFCFDPK